MMMGLEQTAETIPPNEEHPPLTEFTIFGDLPPGIQSNIWNLAFPTRRFVVIQLQDIRRKYFEGVLLPQMYGVFSTPTPAPYQSVGTVATSDEATRAEFERFRPALFGTRHEVGLPGTIPFDYHMDVAFFSRGPAPKKSNPLDFLGSRDINRIQQIAIEPEGPWFHHLVRILPLFPHLKRLFLVFNDGDELTDLRKYRAITKKDIKDLRSKLLRSTVQSAVGYITRHYSESIIVSRDITFEILLLIGNDVRYQGGLWVDESSFFRVPR